CDREVFLPLGPEGSWDPDYSEINHAGPLLVDDQLWFFYRGTVLERPRGTGPDLRKGLGLATLRRDGFASLVGDAGGGTVTTRPLTWSGGRLVVNAAVQPGGSVRAEVLTHDGRAVDGFSAAECRRVDGDSTSAPLRWSGGEIGGARDRDPGERPLRLRFHLQAA